MTCAYDAAGKKVRASNAAIAIFFTIDNFLQDFEFQDFEFQDSPCFRPIDPYQRNSGRIVVRSDQQGSVAMIIWMLQMVARWSGFFSGGCGKERTNQRK
jgi:hypothetical protein